MDDKRYFNVPVQLLQGFMSNTRKCQQDIFDYAIYNHAFNHISEGKELTRIRAALNYYGVKAGNENATLSNGEDLFNSIPEDSPKVGINKDVYFDFYKNEKTDFVKACFLAFLALKSIINKKAYCRITNAYLWARMDGKTHSVDNIEDLSPDIQRFANEYQMRKIKTELRNNWKLVYYGRYTRGCYYSFTLQLDELVFQAEKKRKSTIDKMYKDQERQAVYRAMERLYKGNGNSPKNDHNTTYNKGISEPF